MGFQKALRHFGAFLWVSRVVGEEGREFQKGFRRVSFKRFSGELHMSFRRVLGPLQMHFEAFQGSSGRMKAFQCILEVFRKVAFGGFTCFQVCFPGISGGYQSVSGHFKGSREFQGVSTVS